MTAPPDIDWVHLIVLLVISLGSIWYLLVALCVQARVMIADLRVGFFQNEADITQNSSRWSMQTQFHPDELGLEDPIHDLPEPVVGDNSSLNAALLGIGAVHADSEPLYSISLDDDDL